MKKASAMSALSETLATQATRNKFAGSGIENENISKKQLAEELHKPIWKFKKRKAHSPFKDNIWVGDLADM